MKIHTVQLNIGDLFGGTTHMDATEFGAYVALFLHMYQLPTGTLPDDDIRLARIAKCPLKTWKRIKSTVVEKFTLNDGSYAHERVSQEKTKYSEISETNRNNALKRYNRQPATADNPQNDRNAIQNPIYNTQYTEGDSPLPPSTLKGSKPYDRRKSTGQTVKEKSAAIIEARNRSAQAQPREPELPDEAS